MVWCRLIMEGHKLFHLCCTATLLSYSFAFQNWDYSENGPDKWVNNYPSCQGELQSPVNINLEEVWYNSKLTTFEMPRYESIPRNAHWELRNTGHSVQLLLNGDYILSDGALEGDYKAAYMEFHWGKTNRAGSEHKINGQQSAMEAQIVHYSTKHGSFDEALQQPNGIAVISFLFKLTKFDSPSYRQIIESLANITNKGETTMLRPLPLLSLLPVNLNDYWRYEGSLTVPPCTENVIWSVFNDQIPISKKQVEQFRENILSSQADDEKKVPLKQNFRPTHELNGRTIYSSNPDDATMFSHPLSSPMSITMAAFLGILVLLFFTNRSVES